MRLLWRVHIYFFLVAAALSVSVLLIATRFDLVGLAAASKIFASSTFLLIAASGFFPASPFTRSMMTALVLCAIGDVLLISKRTFDIGLLTFLAGHLAFAFAFALVKPIGSWPPLILIPLSVIGITMARWLWPHLGQRKIPVLVYIVAISVMLWGACSVSLAQQLPWWTAFGALLFMVSDIFVARNRFFQPSFTNRAFGLPMYYCGQILLALSLSIP